MKTVMVAHRGAQVVAPENTLSAFRLAIKNGFKAIECDVQLTKDGQLVVIHDETVDRTTSGSGWVSQLTCDQIQELKVEGGERVPLLAEVCDLVVVRANMRLIIEIKGDTELHAKKVATSLAIFLRQFSGKNSRLIEVHSFWYDALAVFASLRPAITTAAIINGGFDSGQVIDIARRTGAKGVSLGYEFVSRSLVRDCHKSNLFVDVWAISDATVLKRLRRFGVNAVVENYTGKMIRA